MKMLKLVKITALVGVLLLAIGSVASANMLTNPGFEAGDFTGWNAWDNSYVELARDGFYPYEGSYLMSFFGNWWGSFNVSGAMQEFPAIETSEWMMSCKSRHNTADPLTQDGVDDNWVVMKIAFLDADGAELGGVEATIMDGSYPLDVWNDNAPIMAVAPAGTAKVQALLLYLQPMFDGGACHIDNVEFTQTGPVPVEESTWGKVKSLYK